MTTSARPCDSPAVRNRSIALPFYTKFLQQPAAGVAKTPAFPGPFSLRLSALILHRSGPAAGLQGGRVTTRLELILDRFVPSGNGRAVDLANGGLVCLRTASSREDRDRRRRAETAARVSALRIAGMAPLVDYGLGGRDEWIEAYGLGALDEHAGSAADLLRSSAGAIAALLVCAGLAVRNGPRSRRGAEDPPRLFIPEPLERVIAADDEEEAAEPPAAPGGLPAAGTILERRDELDPVMEWIGAPADSGARIVGSRPRREPGCARSSRRLRGRRGWQVRPGVEPVLRPGCLPDSRRRPYRALRHAARPPRAHPRQARREWAFG